MSDAAQKPSDGVAFAALLVGAICIGLSPIFVRVSETGPTATAFWRVALALPVLWLARICDAARLAQRTRAIVPWPLLAGAGLAFAGDLGFWHLSIKLTSVANSTLLANLAAIFVTLAGWLIFRHRPSGMFLVGLFTALAGVGMLVSTSLAFSPTALAGDGLGVVTALFYAWYLLTVKHLRDRGVDTLLLMTMTTTVTAILLLPVALATGEPMLPATGAGWLKLLGVALISHTAGQGLIAYSLAHLPAAFTSVSLLLQPVMAAMFAWTLLDEPLVPIQVAGGIVVLAGIYLARRA